MVDSRARFLSHREVSQKPDRTDARKAERAARQMRLAEALRANLRRRKEQSRTRAAPADPASVGLSGAPLSSKSKPHGGNTAD
jgi:hypothetical protein